MWISPNHPDPPRHYSPPVDDGEPLATVPRGDDAELRVTLKRYKGRPYVSLRVWGRDDAGEWWPSKTKGVSVRLGELDAVIEALQSAREATTLPPRLRPGQGPWTRPSRS